MKLFPMIAMTMLPSMAMAQQQVPVQVLQGITTAVSSSGTTFATCGSANSDDCNKSDLAATINGKAVLLRGLYGCKATAEKLKGSYDVTAAECFMSQY